MKERNRWHMFSLILIIIVFLTGCAGLGDWTIELGAGYAIDRVNADEKIVTRQRNEISSRELIIDDFYAQKYLVHGNIICVGGLKTHSGRKTITDEERQNGSTIYYIINTEDDSVIGPFDLNAVYCILDEETDFTEEPSFTILPGKR